MYGCIKCIYRYTNYTIYNIIYPYIGYIYYIKININYSIITMFKEKSSKKKYISDNN